MHRKVFLALIVACSLVAPALANPTIDPGSHVLLPNTPNQQFFVLISPGPVGNANDFGGTDGNEQTIPAVDLALSIGDGSSGPKITGIDIIGPGTVFNANNTGQNDVIPPTPWEVIVSTTTTAANIELLASGNLARVTVDTTGILALPAEQTWLLSLVNLTLQLPTGIGYDPFDPGPLGFGSVTLLQGELSIPPVPEPATFVMAGFGMLAFGVVAVRRHRRASRAA